jgi:L-aspartate oxidase
MSFSNSNNSCSAHEPSKNQNQLTTLHCDVLIVGAGLAGLTLALEVAQHRAVIIIAKRTLTEAATAWAQGGIVGVIDEKDSIESHVGDTLEAGAGIVSETVARFIAVHSQDAVKWLLNQGVAFTKDADGPMGLHLTKEGGHMHRRIAHAADATGREIHSALLKKAKAHPNIQLLENWIAIDLITHRHLHESPSWDDQKNFFKKRCYGVYALDMQNHSVRAITSHDVVMATGGVGKVYRHTTNPDTATGDGIAMAYHAGCRVGNMEFIQFHPTCLYHPQERSFLITEALRGEGAYLRLPCGYRFMADYDERLELAPRDIVARAIDVETKKQGIDFVLLDATHLGEQFLQAHFPTIYSRCLALGIDITKEGIPVLPAAHYACGGIVTDLHGQTDLPHLFAVGESAYTGLHGANRLASNSLLECVVMSKASAKIIIKNTLDPMLKVMPWDDRQVSSTNKKVLISHYSDALRLLMSTDVGIVRSTKKLEQALQQIKVLQKEVQDHLAKLPIHREIIELRNMLLSAELIVQSALSRKESRGLHYSSDYPQTYVISKPTILIPR